MFYSNRGHCFTLIRMFKGHMRTWKGNNKTVTFYGRKSDELRELVGIYGCDMAK